MFWPHFQCKWNKLSEARVKVQGFNGEWFELESLTVAERLDWAQLYFETWIAGIASNGRRLQMPTVEDATILPPDVRGMLRQAKLLTFTMLQPGSNDSIMPSLFASLNGDSTSPTDPEPLPSKGSDS